ncbi:MAG: diguanylate cyclase [Alphaproteobacteria bacterium]
MSPEDDLERRLRALLADPANADHPLRAPVEELVERHARQRRLLGRIMRISDRAQAQLRDVNLTLQAASLTDPLTGLANRRHLLERFRREAIRAKRTGAPIVVFLADVDRFKIVNDTWGHATGDAVLASLAELLQAQLREYDLCGRWGGEEFLILLPETPIEGGMIVAEKLRVAVAEARPGGERRPDMRVSLSVGVALHDTDQPVEHTIQRADAALYAAKIGGRNRCVSSRAA